MIELEYRPLVSIVIPAYNATNYLDDAIKSALNQTYKNIEIIVINDGSCDGGETDRLAKSYGDKIKYFYKENGGSSSALNMGIKNMSGEWFSWLSHDDVFYKNKIEKQIGLLNQLYASNKTSIFNHFLVGPADIIDSSGKIVKRSKYKKALKVKKVFDKKESNEILISTPIQFGFYGCSCLIPKSAFEKVGLFNEGLRLLNDVDMWFRLYANGYKPIFIPDALVQERVHSSQISKSIGYSYHNKEQDDFWKISYEWLIRNCEDKLELFVNYGTIAYKKTRYADGKKAFKYVKARKPGYSLALFIKKIVLIPYSAIRELLKKIYLKTFS